MSGDGSDETIKEPKGERETQIMLYLNDDVHTPLPRLEQATFTGSSYAFTRDEEKAVQAIDQQKMETVAAAVQRALHERGFGYLSVTGRAVIRQLGPDYESIYGNYILRIKRTDGAQMLPDDYDGLAHLLRGFMIDKRVDISSRKEGDAMPP